MARRAQRGLVSTGRMGEIYCSLTHRGQDPDIASVEQLIHHKSAGRRCLKFLTAFPWLVIRGRARQLRELDSISTGQPSSAMLKTSVASVPNARNGRSCISPTMRFAYNYFQPANVALPCGQLVGPWSRVGLLIYIATESA